MNDFIETGYNPPTELKDDFAVSGYPDFDSSASIHFYKSENCTSPELQQAIRATVFLTDGNRRGGSGVIIKSEDKKYLVTNHHVVPTPEVTQSMRCEYKDKNGAIQSVPISELRRIVDSSNAEERGLPTGDVAIFEFTGDNEGVEISDLELIPNNKEVAVASGFPGKFTADDKSNPLLSIGNAVSPLKESSSYVQKLIEQSGSKQIDFLSKILFSGRTMSGNSGGPLIDKSGRILGICRGPQGSLGKETGLEEFIDFRPAIRSLKLRNVEMSSA